MEKNIVAALQAGYTEPIRDSLWGHIYLTPELKALTESAPFLRLHRILQLGPASRVYPGATHTRASHSIGVYHIARRLLINLAEKGASSWISPMGVCSFLCACLLHDLGHFPYTHSLKELALESHEALTAAIIKAEPVRSLVAAAGGDPDFTAAIVDGALPGKEGELLFYRKILSGVLDPDKLDYLNRDATYCGVPYGAQDVDFILDRLEPQKERGVDIDSRGIPSVESILFSKYLMYRTVYWQRSVRSATAMIKKALLGALKEKLIAAEDLYGLDDQGLFTLMEAKFPNDSFFSSLAGKVRSGALYQSVAEIPFDEKLHSSLLNIENRLENEEILAGKLSHIFGFKVAPSSVIIDIPEPISFESGLWVSDESRLFGESSSTFKPELVEAFVKSLRITRIFMESEKQVFFNGCFGEKAHLSAAILN
ncbi:MAG: HD domain-containing protein [Treponema sp.]|jgi:HD superfamily phosphohydrolase|nr:HD domain-containing protein [Treponema sp.]